MSILTTIQRVADLAKKHHGGYGCVRQSDHDGERGTNLVFRWNDEDDSDAFSEALGELLEDKVADRKVAAVTHEFERGVLTSCVRVSSSVKL